MLRNLMAEMTRAGLKNKDLAATIGKSEKSISNKIGNRTEFTREEMVLIKKKHFPGCSLEYLFSQEQ